MNVLSLFDGISCAQLAMKMAGIKYDKYYASEIDVNPIGATQHHFPDTIQLGSITNWKDWNIPFSEIDFIFAGFPCQAWSPAGEKKGTDDPRGALALTLMEVFEHIRKLNPNVKFLFENVKMKNAHNNFLNELFGVKSILIDSKLVSAQLRKRNYWTNIEGIGQPEDKNINLKDILETGPEEDFQWLSKDRSDYILSLASLPHKQRKEIYKNKLPLPENIKIIAKEGDFIYTNHLGQNGGLLNPKSATIVTSSQNSCVAKLNGELRIRRLTILELERLQMIPDGYTSIMNKTHAKRAIGNGWTIGAIAHILKYL